MLNFFSICKTLILKELEQNSLRLAQLSHEIIGKNNNINFIQNILIFWLFECGEDQASIRTDSLKI